MKIQAEVSLYPLRTNDFTKAIKKFVNNVEQEDIEVQTGTMSTLVSGNCRELFDALGSAFDKASQDEEIVLVIKVSNACSGQR